MTIRKRLLISFSLILFIVTFIVGVFFYTIYNLNSINYQQSHRYDQLIRVEKLKEFSNSYSWIVLDITTDFDKLKIVDNRINKAEILSKNLNNLKKEILDNSESNEENKNLDFIFKNLNLMQKLIKNDLLTSILVKNNNLDLYNKTIEELNIQTQKLLFQEINYLQKKLTQTQNKRNEFLDTIKLELVILFIILLLISLVISSKIINEIKDKLDKLNLGILQLFKNSEKTIKIDIGKNNELSIITDNLNSFLQKQADIISSREELLRNISHELKTPIAKGKFIIEKLSSKDHQILKDINTVFYDIEKLTNKLLERDKLNFAVLKITKFKVSTVILEALSKLSIENESMVRVNIKNDFDINADFYYLTIVFKNLFDNAIKYAIEFPIEIQSNNDKVYIKNISNKLSNDLIYYIQPFTREPNQVQGHGLGLNIVSKILNLHDFNLEHEYKDNYNIFKILFK